MSIHGKTICEADDNYYLGYKKILKNNDDLSAEEFNNKIAEFIELICERRETSKDLVDQVTKKFIVNTEVLVDQLRIPIDHLFVSIKILLELIKDPSKVVDSLICMNDASSINVKLLSTIVYSDIDAVFEKFTKSFIKTIKQHKFLNYCDDQINALVTLMNKFIHLLNGLIKQSTIEVKSKRSNNDLYYVYKLRERIGKVIDNLNKFEDVFSVSLSMHVFDLYRQLMHAN